MRKQWLRIVSNVRERGVVKTMQGIMSKVGDYAFDLRYGTDTATRVDLQDLQIESGNKRRGVNYMPTHAGPFSKLIRALDLPKEGVFVDLGCGKGKILLLASQYGFKRLVGVEFSHELCEAARRNADIFQMKTGIAADIVIVELDVVEYEIEEDQNVFFLFNPFDDVVLRRTLGNIVSSFERKPRMIWLIYNHPTCSDIIDQQSCFSKFGSYQYGATEFAVYTVLPSDPSRSQTYS